jgi:peptide-methionine (R)-S-oxide reductase
METRQFEFTRTDDEWRHLLSPEQYEVMRGHGTEAPGSCALNYEKRPGTFVCAGCGQPLFVSQKKFESGSRRRRRRDFRGRELRDDPHRGTL